jgi:transcriptional regulator with XRE-family HTH domain
VGLRELRLDQALTQQELASKAGLSKTTIVNIEAGRIWPHPPTVRKIAAVLGIPPKQLVQALREQTEGQAEIAKRNRDQTEGRAETPKRNRVA